MTATVGFIGTGNMGAALARAVCKTVPPQQVLLANRTPAKAEALAEELGCAAGTNEEVARACRLIFLGVKPQVMGEMLASLTPVLKEREDCFVLVTMGRRPDLRPDPGDGGGGLPGDPGDAQHPRGHRRGGAPVLRPGDHGGGYGLLPKPDGPRRAGGSGA